MALPTNQRTYQISGNNFISGDTTTSIVQQTLLAIKNYLKAGYGVTVKGSSNSTTAAMDGVDRWSANTDIVRGSGPTSPHSWIVLTSAELGIEIYLGYYGTDATRYILGFSHTAYTLAGTPTHKPTVNAADEVPVAKINTRIVGADTSTALPVTLHMWRSTDGKSFRFVTFQAGDCTAFVVIDEIQSRVLSGTFSPAVVAFSMEGANDTLRANHTRLRFRLGGRLFDATDTTCALSWEEPAGSGPFDALSFGTYSSNYTMDLQTESGPSVIGMQTIGVYSTAPGLRGYVGHFIDLWLGGAFNPNGAAIPYSGDITHVMILDLVLPWINEKMRVA